MPERRTRDVIHVTMTDHRIVRDPGGADLVAPIEKRDTEVTDVFIRDPHSGLGRDEQVIYKAVAVLRYTLGTADYAADALDRLLRKTGLAAVEPWLELAESRVKSRDFDAALSAAEEAARRAPAHPKVRDLKAVAVLGRGDTKAAVALMQALLSDHPELPEQRYQLAVMHRADGDDEAALREARRAIASRHNLWIAWRLVGEIEQERGHAAEAADAFATALSIEPDDPRASAGMVAALEALGKADAAARYRGVAPAR
jgi:tetratricopeptide (TPR) repeat protein